MAHLVVITHQFDVFSGRNAAWPGRRVSFYMLFPVLKAFAKMGHSSQVVAGPNPVPGDAAILHVDGTIVAPEYAMTGENYRCPINFRTTDISKRNVSAALIDRHSHWAGNVIVKTNRNVMGKIEVRHNAVAKRRGLPMPHPGVEGPGRYLVLESAAHVPDAMWDDPDLVVERYVPEIDPDGFVIRCWTFVGDVEVCWRNVCKTWHAKGGHVLSSTECEVPDAIRRERERLGLDYGNLDFVIHEGEPILLDASRTIGAPEVNWDWAENMAPAFAEGLIGLIERQASG